MSVDALAMLALATLVLVLRSVIHLARVRADDIQYVLSKPRKNDGSR